MQAPVVEYRDATGASQRYQRPFYACPVGYAVGDSVIVLVDPQDPTHRRLESDSRFFWPSLMGGVGGIALVAAFFVRPRRDWLQALGSEPQMDEIMPLVALADARGGAAGSGDGGPPLKGIVASADCIGKGEIPLDLCELCAYMASLAYERLRDDGVDKSTLRVVDYLADPSAFPHHGGTSPFQHVKAFYGGETEGFGFVLDGGAFIVLRGTQGWSDWRGNLDAWPTGETDLLPPGMDKAPPRHPGFVKGWAAIRDQVEAWINEHPSKADLPFIITGHSLGGALSFIAAWELAHRGRKVAAVITFGAALPGLRAFADDYKALGLDARTLQLEFTQDIVPEAQKLIGYVEVGRIWEPKRIPFVSHRAALAALPIVWMADHLGSSLVPQFGKSKPDKATGGASGVMSQASIDVRAPAADNRSLMQLGRAWLRRLIFFAAFSSVLALAAHKMQKRYGLALSTMSYRKIRDRHAAAAANRMLTESDLAKCYDELCHHLSAVRGSTPDNPGPFKSIARLPHRLTTQTDMRWFNTFFGARSW